MICEENQTQINSSWTGEEKQETHWLELYAYFGHFATFLLGAFVEKVCFYRLL